MRQLNTTIGGTATLRAKLTFGPKVVAASFDGNFVFIEPVSFLLYAPFRTSRTTSMSLFLAQSMFYSSNVRLMTYLHYIFAFFLSRHNIVTTNYGHKHIVLPWQSCWCIYLFYYLSYLYSAHIRGALQFAIIFN